MFICKLMQVKIFTGDTIYVLLKAHPQLKFRTCFAHVCFMFNKILLR